MMRIFLLHKWECESEDEEEEEKKNSRTKFHGCQNQCEQKVMLTKE